MLTARRVPRGEASRYGRLHRRGDPIGVLIIGIVRLGARRGVGSVKQWGGFPYSYLAAATGLTGRGTLHSSMCPAGFLNHSSRRLRRDSTSAVNAAVSVRKSSRFVRSGSGTSAATLIEVIGTRISGFS